MFISVHKRPLQFSAPRLICIYSISGPVVSKPCNACMGDRGTQPFGSWIHCRSMCLRHHLQRVCRNALIVALHVCSSGTQRRQQAMWHASVWRRRVRVAALPALLAPPCSGSCAHNTPTQTHTCLRWTCASRWAAPFLMS